MNHIQYYVRANAAARALSIANKLGMPWRGRAMGLYNKHMAALRRMQQGCQALAKHTPDFECRVAGIPCGVVVLHYYRGDNGMIDRSPGAGFGDAVEPVEASVEFILVDLDNYRAKWLEAKISDTERLEIESIITRGDILQ